MKSIVEQARELQPKTVATRRDLHMHPEIAFEEHRTMGVVADRLRELGLEPRTGLGGTGVVAVLETGKAGPTVLARADMDALPVPEEKDVAYRSKTPEKMHACGHDGHTSVLLSVAEALVSRKDELAGRVVFVFQPAEEIVRGAKAMLDDGALDGIRVDHVIGLHLSSNDDVGTVSVREGPAMAATDSFRLLVRGKGGHAAYPQDCIDPIVAASQVVTALQTLVSRETEPADQSVVSITSFHAGTAYNIIPDQVELKGTLRTFDAGTRERLAARVLEVADTVCRAYRAKLESEWFDGTPAVVNDAGSVERLRRVAAGVVGEENVVEQRPIMGGDDMALWLQQAKGVYFFVGTRSGDSTAWPHHNPHFDIDERGLEVAVSVLASGVVDLLVAD
ncbi:MAG TPA: M20 family metallopeptidase [Trueperaceae bacterium]|nr:M20 family metallopeptidase [Trueperaceae bacterium]